MIVNEHDTLMFESYLNFTNYTVNLRNEDIVNDCFYQILYKMDQDDLNNLFGWMFMQDDSWIEHFVSWLQYETVLDAARESYSISVFMNAEHHYGLPERSAKFNLRETYGVEPYRLYAIDLFPHEEWNTQGLYSGIPYITGHHEEYDASIAWVSASETWVDIIASTSKSGIKGRHVHFISESGVMEVFLFSSAALDSPR